MIIMIKILIVTIMISTTITSIHLKSLKTWQVVLSLKSSVGPTLSITTCFPLKIMKTMMMTMIVLMMTMTMMMMKVIVDHWIYSKHHSYLLYWY